MSEVRCLSKYLDQDIAPVLEVGVPLLLSPFTKMYRQSCMNCDMAPGWMYRFEGWHVRNVGSDRSSTTGRRWPHDMPSHGESRMPGLQRGRARHNA